MKRAFTALLVFCCLGLSHIASAELTNEKVTELSDALFLKKTIAAMILKSRRDFKRYSGFASPTSKAQQVLTDISNKLQPTPLYNFTILELKKSLTLEEANAIIEFAKTDAYKKFLMKTLYLATNEGYRVGKKAQTNFELGIFKPDPKRFEKIIETMNSSHRHLKFAAISGFYNGWLYNVELGKVYPHFELSKTAYVQKYQDGLENRQVKSLEHLKLTRYLYLENLNDQEVDQFNEADRSPAMLSLDNASMNAYLNFLSSITTKQAPELPNI